MFLKNKQNGTLIEVQDTTTLVNPVEKNICGRTQAGEEEQPTEEFAKNTLIFPSGENLPLCWTDADYQASL
jgi:hypothetical protein